MGLFKGSIILAGLALAGLTASAASAQAAPKPPAFAMCAVCHKTAKGEQATIGPNLFGVGGRKSGSLPGFAYSPAMKKAGITWKRDTLIQFITTPLKTVPGNRMPYAGQKDPKIAAAIADYLLSLK